MDQQNIHHLLGDTVGAQHRKLSIQQGDICLSNLEVTDPKSYMFSRQNL